ncbi:hypothetical protein DSO57_1021337 [Entomophthora muscae]|uniref:Uncharacterized protein n=1 Tax=Entomophthora muscae TaxID=34485 RepID=A0ACC2SSQ7_9FUNG|nr:hypothetical protein DSO57_1021337 [Entomophthora muscae]
MTDWPPKTGFLTPPHLLPLHLLLLLPPSTLIFYIPFTFPKNSSPNKSDGDLTNHSFYHSEVGFKPTKEQHTKKSKAVKEPTSSSGKKKKAFKQA